MKTFKHLFLITSLLLFGGFLIAQDTPSPGGGNESAENEKQPNSNPKDCVLKCKSAPEVEVGPYNDDDEPKVLSCTEDPDFDQYKQPDNEPTTKPGKAQEECTDGSTKPEVDVKVTGWTWAITNTGGYQAGVPGTYTITSTGTAIIQPAVEGCELTATHTFEVVLKKVVIKGSPKLLACDEEVYKAEGGTAPYSFFISKNPHLADLQNGLGDTATVKGKGLSGEIEITVTDSKGCVAKKTVNCTGCIEEAPRMIPLIDFVMYECEVGEPDSPFYAQVYKSRGKDIFGSITHCVDGKTVTEPLGWSGIRFTTWSINGPGTIYKELGDYVYVKGADQTTVLTANITDVYEGCEDTEVTFTANINCNPPNSGPNLAGKDGKEANTFAQGNKFAMLDLHGKPQTILKPQGKSEKDLTNNEFTIDAYHLTHTYTETDIDIPLQGTDLRLQMKRTNSAVTASPGQGGNEDNIPHRTILGRSWRSNIAPVVYLRVSSEVRPEGLFPSPDACNADLPDGTAPSNGSSQLIVQDESGASFKYHRNNFTAEIQSFSDPEGQLHKLEETESGYLFTKKNGTVLEYESVDFEVEDSERTGQYFAFNVSISNFARVKSINDRNGNKLIYEYPELNSVLPDRIYYEQHPEIDLTFTYNPERTKLLKVTDPLGREIDYEHTGEFLTKVIQPQVPIFDPATKTEFLQRPETNYEYTSVSFVSEEQKLDSVKHALQRVIDPEGNEIFLTYDTQKIGGTEPAKNDPFLASTVPSEGAGSFPSFEMDFKAQQIVYISSVTSPDGTANFSISTHTSAARTIEVTDSAGYEWSYEFNVRESPIEYINGNIFGGEKVLNKFSRSVQYSIFDTKTMHAFFQKDITGTVNLTSVIDYYGNVTNYEYGVNPVTFFRDGVEVTEEYNFGRYNQPSKEILDATPEGGDPENHLNITKEFGYESTFNQMVRIVDPNGNETLYDIDDEGNRVREVAPLGKITTFTYDFGYKTSTTDADGRSTSFNRVYNPSGWTDSTTVTGYNNELDITSTESYDLVGNLIKTIDGNGNETDHYYDETNMLERTEFPAVDDFDTEGDILIRPTIHFKRNKNRQVTGKQDARGNWTLTEYDGMLRPVTVTVEVSTNNAENIVTTTEYDSAGNKSAVIDPRGIRYQFSYDAFNNLIQEIKDAGQNLENLNLTSTYEYGSFSGNDLFGDSGFVPTKKVDPRGISTILEYDNAYRLIKTSKGYENYEVLLSQISYDQAGNVIKTTTYNDRISNLNGNYSLVNANITSGNQETVTEYDALNRPVATAVALNGNGASINDPNDIITNTFYDLSGNVIIAIDPEGHSTQTEYDGAGRVVKLVVNLDDNPQFGEVGGNQYTIIANEDDIVTTKSYDDNNNYLTETILNDTPGAAGNQTLTKTYDALNRVVTIIDPEGNISETKYDLNSNTRLVKNARGFDTATEYDEANRAIKQILPEVFDAEANSSLGENTNPEVITFYDTNGNVIKTVDARGLATLNLYDALNRLDETRQVVGTDDRTSEETDDIISENEYDQNSNLTETTFLRDDTELTTSTIYDALDRPLVTVDPEGFQTVVFCDLVGNKVLLFDKRSNTRLVDGIETKDEVPQLRYYTEVTFDRANRMVKNTLPEIPVASRDELGGVNDENIQPFSRVVYLKNNWVDKTIDLNGNETSTVYDNAGRKLSVTNAIGQTISYTYDKSSNVLSQIVENNDFSGGNQLTTYTYDKRNLLLTETLNKDHATLERIYTYTYDENGNKKTRAFPNEDTTTYNFDALNRLTSEVYTNATDENRTFTYNNNGAVVTCTDNTGTVRYEYDILGRQITETKLNTEDIVVSLVESVYDKANNRIRCFFPNNKKTLVSLYDKRNLLTTMKGFHGKVLPDDEATYPGQAEITSYLYNANGAQVSCTLPNGQTTVKAFDQADRITNSTTSSAVLTETVNSYTATYKRDAVGNQLEAVETRTVANGAGTRTRTLNFIYDDVYRLIVESDDLSGQTEINTYIYDLQGNRSSRIQQTQGENDQDSWIYTNDLLNRTTAVQIDLKGIGNTSSYAYQYDDNGNREVRSFTNENNEASTHTYFYDQENRLVRVNDGNDDIFKASYDYRTRRTAKTEVNSQDQFETVAYIYDGGVSCQEVKVTTGEEYDGTNGSLDKQYIRGNGMGGGIGSVCYMERTADFRSVSSDVQNFYDAAGYGPTTLNGSSNMLAEYFCYNAVGSVVSNTDQQGFVIRENDFDAYGVQVRSEDHTPNNFPIEFGGSQNDLLFSTKERDFSTGLDYFGFRYYDSVLGKFITRDPSGYPDGPNNYLYVNNNPINSIDPLGLSAESKLAEIEKRRQKQIAEAKKRAEAKKNKANSVIQQTQAEHEKTQSATKKAHEVNRERIRNSTRADVKEDGAVRKGGVDKNYYVQDGEVKGKPNSASESIQKKGTGGKPGNSNPNSAIKKATEGLNKADDIRAQRIAKTDIVTSMVSMALGFYNLFKADSDAEQIQSASDAMKGTGFLATGLAAMNGSKLAQGANPWLMGIETIRPSSLSFSQILKDIDNGDGSGGSLQTIVTSVHMLASEKTTMEQTNEGLRKVIQSDKIIQTRLEKSGTYPGVLKRIQKDKSVREKEYQAKMEKASRSLTCFIEGTKVYTVNGFKDIEAIRKGNYVLSYSTKENMWTFRKVIRKFDYEYKGEMVAITTENGVIHSTGDHPFFVYDKSVRKISTSIPRNEQVEYEGWKWINATDLKTGDILKNKNNKKVIILKIEKYFDLVNVFNITVKDNHNYLVGENSVLVHNR